MYIYSTYEWNLCNCHFLSLQNSLSTKRLIKALRVRGSQKKKKKIFYKIKK